MKETSYWERITRSRLTRRRALVGAGALGAGAAALSLIGCGGGDDGGAPKGLPEDKSGLLSYPEETKAKAGGVYRNVLQTDVTTFDPLTASSFTTQYYIAYFAYPRLLKFKSARYPEPPQALPEGDLAETFQINDPLTITLKLRQGQKWDPRAPTSNRVIDAEDVKWSWDKFASSSPFRGDLVYSETNKSAPVESVQTPDSNTIVIKLKQPDSSITQLLAAGSIFFVLPREADGKFDPKGEVRGYGPWMLETYERGTRYVWAKNPNWYLANRIHPDKVETPIITEYAQSLAQFRAGNIYSSTWVGAPNQTDIIQTKKDVPATLLRQATTHDTAPHIIIFGYAEGSPFRDDRMRKAVSMITDRDLEANFRFNRDKFTEIGLPVPLRYMNAVAAGQEGYWLDPTDEKQMPGLTKYFKYDPAEAKKLMSAAGYKGEEVNVFWMGETFYGAQYTKNCELFLSMYNEGGLRVKSQPKLYQTEYLPSYYYAYSPTGRDKDYSGLILALERTYPTVASQLFASYHPDGARFHGLSPNGLNPTKGDPQVNALIDKMKAEFDLKKQQEIAHDFQKYVIDKMYYVPGGPYPTSVQAFSLIWPVSGNWGIWSTVPAAGVWWVESLLDLYIDDTKPPLGRAT